MRPLRLVSSLVLILALVAGLFAPASIVSAMAGAGAMHGDHAGMGHAGATHGGASHAAASDAHRYGGSDRSAPAHTPDCCQAACCIGSGQPSLRVGDASAIRFFSAVRYADFAPLRQDRAVPPEPGVPKTVA